MVVLRLLKQEVSNLQILQRDYHLSIHHLFNMLKPLQELFYALRLIGIALLLRQVLIFFSSISMSIG